VTRPGAKDATTGGVIRFTCGCGWTTEVPGDDFGSAAANVGAVVELHMPCPKGWVRADPSDPARQILEGGRFWHHAASSALGPLAVASAVSPADVKRASANERARARAAAEDGRAGS
jgi:hypothetical protein